MKTVPGGDGSTYLVPIPGMAPPGLKLSLHPTGEIHLKDRDNGTIARLNIFDVLRAFADGKIDNLLEGLIRSPAPGRKVEGFVVPRGLMERLTGVGDPSKPDLALPATEILSSLTRFEVDDSTRLGEAIALLREQGSLAERGLLMLEVEGSNYETVFLNMGEPKSFVALPDLPDDVPMKRSIIRLFAQLREYGGFFVDWPADEEFEHLVREAGFGEFYEGLRAYADTPGVADLDTTLVSREAEIAAMFSGPIAGLLARPVLRPLDNPPPPPSS